jgi:hypothetical protein
LDSFEKLRLLLLDHISLRTIIDFTGNVFENANVKTAILLFSREKSRDQTVEVVSTAVTSDFMGLEFKKLQQDLFRETYKSIFDLSLDESQETIKRKMRGESIHLGELFTLSFGLKTGDDSRFLTHSPESLEHKPLLRGANIHRYSISFQGEYVWYIPAMMKAHRRTARPGTNKRFEQPKVLIRDTGEGLQGTFDNENYYVKDVIIVSDKDEDAFTLKFLIGLLNSRLMRFYYETSFPTLHVQRNEMASLPIRTINFDDPADIARHDKMVTLVERMLELNKKLSTATITADKQLYQRQIKATDQQIDMLVYELYELTEEEIKIVEEAAE